jgi:hypothetical protein
VRLLGEGRSEGQPILRAGLVRGTIFPAALSLTTITEGVAGENPAIFQSTYFLQPNDSEASPLLLRSISSEEAAKLNLRKAEKEP